MTEGYLNIDLYRQKRQRLQEQAPRYRQYCESCWQPGFGCYCSEVKKFNPEIEFIILIHPIEVKRRIATGRMSHLCLENSKLIRGENYTDNIQVNEILNDPFRQCVILYPGPQSVSVSGMNPDERANLISPTKRLTVFVIDGTWATARKMVRRSENLRSLKRISFIPEAPSRFRVRKQPAPGCYSTIEAIHKVIDLLGDHVGFPVQTRVHDRLLIVFDYMVERQLKFIADLDRRVDSYRRVRKGKSTRSAVIESPQVF
jgi:DTW domain-containing protein YfiP